MCIVIYLAVFTFIRFVPERECSFHFSLKSIKTLKNLINSTFSSKFEQRQKQKSFMSCLVLPTPKIVHFSKVGKGKAKKLFVVILTPLARALLKYLFESFNFC